MLLFTKYFKIKQFSKKFTNKFINLYHVLKFVNSQTYYFVLSINVKIYFVFHVFFLKSNIRCSNNDKILKYLFFELINDNYQIYEIEKILDKKFSKKKIFYKIK